MTWLPSGKEYMSQFRTTVTQVNILREVFYSEGINMKLPVTKSLFTQLSGGTGTLANDEKPRTL